LQEKAKWAADYLKLDYEYRFTGYGDLDRELTLAARPAAFAKPPVTASGL
jgi:hypothetical protein